MNLRRFNAAGIHAFQEYLDSCRRDPTLSLPSSMLTDGKLTSLVEPKIWLEYRTFTIRREAAEYFRELLRPLSDHDVMEDDGLWTWLTALFWDSVCPLRQGKRVVRNNYHYVYEPHNALHFYRHQAFIAWYSIAISPIHNRLFLDTKFAHLDKMTEETLKRRFLTRIPCMFEVLDRLYWDNEKQGRRKGVVDQNTIARGDLTHRLVAKIRQLEKTFDLFSLNADQLIELLGDEFQFE